MRANQRAKSSSGENKQTELFIITSCISEHIASTIFNILGIPAEDDPDLRGRRKKVKIEIQLAKIPTADGSRLFDFCPSRIQSVPNTAVPVFN